MVKVITIMDDVYAELYKLKSSKGMSFSEVIRYLMHEREKESKNVVSFAGLLTSNDVDRHAIEGLKRSIGAWKKYF